MDHVVNFSPFVLYGANQIEAKYEFEQEKNSNSSFSKFVEVRSAKILQEDQKKVLSLDLSP